MSDKITFFYNPMSRGRIVHWMLEEVGADYEIKLIDWKKAEHKSPEFLRINPMGKIPAIVHRGTVVTEGAAIIAYLADAFPKAGLSPAIDDPARGTYFRWLFFSASCMEPAILDKKFPRKETPRPSMLGYGTTEDTVNALEKSVAGGYLLGERFSAADVYVASMIEWYLMQKDLEPRPAFVNYVKLCTERPAHRRFTEQAGKLS